MNMEPSMSLEPSMNVEPSVRVGINSTIMSEPLEHFKISLIMPVVHSQANQDNHQEHRDGALTRGKGESKARADEEMEKPRRPR